MENLDSPSLKSKAEQLSVFFETLSPASLENVQVIERSKIDSLIESGVTYEELLSEFVSNGYLLHGSSVGNLQELEPRQGHEEEDIPENKRNAIYAIQTPGVAMFRALVSGIQGKASFSVDTHEYGDGSKEESFLFQTDFDVPQERGGWIYVLPSDTFEDAGGPQFTSAVPVKPAYAIPVHFTDFEHSINKLN